MKIFICHTSDVDKQAVQSVREILGQVSTVMVKVQPESLSVDEVDRVWLNHADPKVPVPWDAMYAIMEELRAALGTEVVEQDFLYVLTARSNELNWFSFHKSAGAGANAYIHTSDWEEFMPGTTDFIYPAAHLVASNVLHHLVFPEMNDWEEAGHKQPQGCLMDLCMDKHEIRLKLKSADVCPDCQPHYKKAIDSERLHPNVLIDCYRLLEAVRERFLFCHRMNLQLQPSRIQITEDRCQVLLSDFGQIVPLLPQQRAMYLYFMERTGEEGIHPRNIDVLRLTYWYKQTANLDDLHEIQTKAARLCENDKFNSLISEIRAHFKEVVGDELTEQHYLWKCNTREARRIPLDRTRVLGMERHQSS